MTHLSRATLIMVLMGCVAPAWAGPPDAMGGPGMMESGPPPGPPAFLKQVFAPKLASRRLPDGRMISSPLEDLAPFLPREELRQNMLIPLVED